MPPKRKIKENLDENNDNKVINTAKISNNNNKNKKKKTDKTKSLPNLDDLLDSNNNNNNIADNELVSSDALLNNLSSIIKNDKRLDNHFFDQYCLDLSKKLLGKILVRRIDDTIVRTKIVEVEAYLGGTDSASHSFNNKCTNRNRAMFMPAGTAYVYNIYGIYCCFNISSKEPGGGVLIRALEPIDNFDILKKNRKLLEKSSIKIHKDLTSGPSRLCQALNITKDLFNEKNLCIDDSLWLENDDTKSIDNSFEIVAAKRINIDYAGEEYCNKLYRFYIKDNKCVSVIDKNAVTVSLLTDNASSLTISTTTTTITLSNVTTTGSDTN